MKKIAVLSVSGGMDSTSLLLNLLDKDYYVYAFSFDYGQRHKLEIERLKLNIKYLRSHGYKLNHKIIDISQMMSEFESVLTNNQDNIPEGHYEEESMKMTVVPNRNAIFASLTYGYALSLANKEKCEILLGLGVHSGDHAIYPDCRPEFYQQLFKAFVCGNWNGEKVKPYFPYIDGDKVTILKDATETCKRLGLRFEVIFRNTNTSYEPDSAGNSSGKTGSDIERILAFHELGLKDPVPYVDGWESALNHALTLKM